MSDAALSAEERKRRRLEAWRKKQQQQQSSQPPLPGAVPPPPPPPPPPVAVAPPIILPKQPPIKLALGKIPVKRKFKAPSTDRKVLMNPFGETNTTARRGGVFDDHDADDEKAASEDDDAGDSDLSFRKRRRPPMDLMLLSTSDPPHNPADPTVSASSPSKKKRKRWDTKGDDVDGSSNKDTTSNFPTGQQSASTSTTTKFQPANEPDALDQFMDQLQSSELPQIVTKELSIQVSGTMILKAPKGGGGSLTPRSAALASSSANTTTTPFPLSGGVITAEQLALFDKPQYTPSDWMSDGAVSDEEEEQARRAMIEALKDAPVTTTPAIVSESEPPPLLENDMQARPAQLAAEVKSEKSRREEQMRELERQAEEARLLAEQAAAPELGRLFNDAESGVMEEAERNLAAAQAAPDALQVLAELNKKKELAAVDHSKIEYLPFTKNLYRVPRALANLSNDEIINRRAKLKVRVRGHGAPAPISSFEECGLSEKILKVLALQNIHEPFPIQAQCIPCIMAGRDVIGIAKTGSGKTLAYLLPLLRHIMAQPPLEAHESGPIGLILAPARELASQIHAVCKTFTKQLGLKSTAVYGGAGVAEQIGELKRGTHIVVATPGRLIDILTMQSGKVLSLRRVTYVVMDEADRMYDMGFNPQIAAISSAIRPDRQSVLFSATFPKAVETLARKSLQYPVEVMVGGRSVASDNVTQYAELVEEDEKFLRLLQLLGEHVEGTNKVIVFVDTQVRADALFEQLLRNGYSSLSLHGGMEQEDRDSTISDFKRKDGPNVLTATGVAGRGLDVPLCGCVINYSSPNHLEAYVHQVGRTGRADNRGVAYTFVNSTDEAKYAPIIVRALSEAGQVENVQPALKELAEDFKKKVEKGEARYAGSGFKGKGYTYDSTELSEAQRVTRLEKRQALIEAGMLDPDDEDPLLDQVVPDKGKRSETEEANDAQSTAASLENLIEIPDNLTPEILALPGMKEALLRKAGIVPADEAAKQQGLDESPLARPVMLSNNHWLQEFEINDYPREARWKVTQRETTSRLQDEFRTAVTLKGSYFPPGKTPGPGERRLYLHLEAASEASLQNCVLEIQRLLNEETLRGAKSAMMPGGSLGSGGSGGGGSHKYNVLS